MSPRCLVSSPLVLAVSALAFRDAVSPHHRPPRRHRGIRQNCPLSPQVRCPLQSLIPLQTRLRYDDGRVTGGREFSTSSATRTFSHQRHAQHRAHQTCEGGARRRI